MNDRLADLKGMGGAGDGAGDLEAGGGGAQSAFMASFFDEVNEVKKVMATIRHNVKLVEQNHGECLIAISGEQTKESRARLEQLMKETNDCAQKVRSRLKGMDQENKDFAKRNEGSSEARIRANMHGTLTRKFVDLMAEYAAPPRHAPRNSPRRSSRTSLRGHRPPSATGTRRSRPSTRTSTASASSGSARSSLLTACVNSPPTDLPRCEHSTGIAS